MSATEIPRWAVRLREERKARSWSQKAMAVNLIKAAEPRTRARMPSVESVQRYVRGYEAGDHKPGDLHATLYCRVFGLPHSSLFDEEPTTQPHIPASPTVTDAMSLVSWITASNTSQAALEHVQVTAARLAETHTQIPAKAVLVDVVQLHRQVQELLQMGKQRPRETRELYRLNSELLAHASMILGDLSEDRTAVEFGKAALLFAKEVDANEALAWAALAKTARWQDRFADSAELANRGYHVSPATPVRAMLASYEARAAGLLGDAQRAREALARADGAAESLDESDPGTSIWSFPRPRQALLALSVSTRTGDPEGALRAVTVADTAWKTGAPRVPSTWAQIRVGAGIAHLMQGSLDGAIEQVTPMLTLEPEFRMATVTRFLDDLAARLRQRRFQRSQPAIELLQQIRVFNAAALPDQPKKGGQ